VATLDIRLGLSAGLQAAAFTDDRARFLRQPIFLQKQVISIMLNVAEKAGNCCVWAAANHGSGSRGPPKWATTSYAIVAQSETDLIADPHGTSGSWTMLLQPRHRS
jgi:hypothetical protein